MRPLKERKNEIKLMPTEKLRRRYNEEGFGVLRPFVEAELIERDLAEKTAADSRAEARADEALSIARLSKVPNPASNPSPNPSDAIKDWHNKPIGSIGIGIIIAILSALALYLIKQHLGLRL